MELTPTTILIIAVILAALVVGAALFMRTRASQKLRAHFGPEYRRTLEETGSRSRAEATLHAREKRVHKFTIRPLTPEDRERYVDSWRQTQAEFVDQPQDAVAHADQLLGKVMTVRGYPMTDFEQRSADLSVEYPEVVQNYRTAHDIAVRHERGEADTEELRQAMIHYRALFEELVGEPEAARSRSVH